VKVRCQVCNKEFNAKPSRIKRGFGKYCSLDCLNKARKEKGVYKTCPTCKKKFYVSLARIKEGRGKFCSRGCAGRWHKGKNSPCWKYGEVEKTCKICGNVFKIKPCKLKSGRGKFCSKECFYKWWNLTRPRGVEHPLWKGGKIKQRCYICGKEFFVGKWRIRRGFGKLCSRRCVGIFVRKNMKTKDTLIELLIEKELKKNNIIYFKQCSIGGISLVDFLLPGKIIIQCDGDYWHSTQERKDRDLNQDFQLSFKGYKVFRFWEKDIKKSAKRCVNKVLRGIMKLQ